MFSVLCFFFSVVLPKCVKEELAHGVNWEAVCSLCFFPLHVRSFSLLCLHVETFVEVYPCFLGKKKYHQAIFKWLYFFCFLFLMPNAPIFFIVVHLFCFLCMYFISVLRSCEAKQGRTESPNVILLTERYGSNQW